MSNGLATIPVSCDSSRTFITNAFYPATSELEDIFEVNFQTQTLEHVCALDFRINALFTLEESLPPPCAITLDADADNSTLPQYDYRADSTCATTPLPIVDADVALLSEIGFLDSLRISIQNTPDGTAEFLGLVLSDSLAVTGNGTHSLLLRPLIGQPSLAAWQNALLNIRYFNNAPLLPSFAEREIRLLAYAAGNVADTARAFLPIFNTTPTAGQDASLSLCPQSPALSLLDHLGGTPAPNGAWQPGSGIFDPMTDAAGDYLYIIAGMNDCPADTAILSIDLLQQASFHLGTDTTLCQGGSLLLQ
ncbi:MAG TPA: hypothetical protein PKA70_23445, partial [Saprospiraceae bacterium]|nr:hypothetical protein [Saprospiraceae bacterium]